MNDSSTRLRRLRSHPTIRDWVAETSLEARHLILPVFVKEGLQQPEPIASLPGVTQHSLDSLENVVDQAIENGLRAIMIFGVPLVRDSSGAEACRESNILHEAVGRAHQRAQGQLVIIADVCLDEFTDHGHCGVLTDEGAVDNDRTIELYSQMAVSLARAGAQVMGLSGMMDHQVSRVRRGLDEAGLHDTLILAYAAKFTSHFYGPFRDAVESTLEGDRSTYQQDFRNRREAAREIAADVDEGADIVMVKPAWTYLDIIRDARETSPVPVAAYVVSGEHAMLEQAAEAGIVPRQAAIRELLLGVRRAGADLIATYWALDVAEWMRKDQWQ